MLISLRWRLFASYFIIIVVGVLTLFGAASLIGNAFFRADIRDILAQKAVARPVSKPLTPPSIMGSKTRCKWPSWLPWSPPLLSQFLSAPDWPGLYTRW